MPENLSKEARSAKITKQKIMPIMVARKAKRILARRALGWLMIESSLIDKTGKTQGIMFRIRPPRRARRM